MSNKTFMKITFFVLFAIISFSSFGQQEEFQSYTTVDSLGSTITHQTVGGTDVDSVIFASETMTWKIVLKNGTKYEYVYKANKNPNQTKGKIANKTVLPDGFYDKANNKRVQIVFTSCPNNINRIKITYPDDQYHKGISERMFQYR